MEARQPAWILLTKSLFPAYHLQRTYSVYKIGNGNHHYIFANCLNRNSKSVKEDGLLSRKSIFVIGFHDYIRSVYSGENLLEIIQPIKIRCSKEI